MPGFKTATKDGVQQTGFVFAKDASSQEVKKIATSADFQVGLSNLPKDLTVTGKATFTQGLSGSLTRLTDDTSYLVAGENITITSASNGQVTITGTTQAPVDATYIVFSSNATLTSERIITAGSGITITDGGAGGSLTIAATGGGSGDVVGPASATDNAIARFNLTTGKLIQNSGVVIDDSNNITTTGDIAINGGDITSTASSFNLLNSTVTTLNVGGVATNITAGSSTATVTMGQSILGAWPSSTTYAYFAHKDATSATDYALLQASPAGTKNTWINAPTGGKVYIANNDTAVGYLDNNEVSLTGQSGVATIATLGNTTSTSSVTINAGTGNIDIGTSNSARTINIGSDPTGTATSMQTINIGAKNTTGFNVLHLIDEDSSNGHEIYILSDNGTQTSGTSVVEIGTVAAATTIDIGKSTVGIKDVTIGGTGGASSLTLDAGTGDINIGAGGSARTTNIATGAAVQTINLGTSASANIISLGSNAAQSIGINGGSALNLLTNAGTTTIDSGGLSNTGVINIGVFGYAQTISIGNTTGVTSVALRAGSGGITFETATTVSSNLTVTGDLAVNGGDITTTSGTFNLVNTASTVNLGSTIVTRTINIGTNATNIQTINVGTGNAANAIAIGSNAASSVGINGGDALNLLTDAGTITMDSGGSSGTGVINMGTFGYAQTITVGNTTGTTSLLLQAGTGNIALSGGNSTTYTIGTSSTTGTIIVGQSTDTNIINIGNGATVSTKTQTINVGNSTASGGITNINIGAASNGTNTITIGKFGSGLVNVILGGDDIQIGDNATSDVGFFGTTPQPKTTVTDITNSVTAGGAANTLTNYTNLITYSTDAAAIRNNFYQIGVKLNTIIDALQSYGLI